MLRSHVFEDRAKRKYGLISNYIYNMKEAREWDRKLFWAQILMIIPNVGTSLLGTFLPSRLVTDLSAGMEIRRLLLELGALALAMWLCSLLFNMALEYCELMGDLISTHYARKYARKAMDVDYDYLEDAQFQKISGNAWRVARYGQGVSQAVLALPLFLSSMMGVLVYGFLLARRSIILLAAVAASVGISLWLLAIARKKHGQYYEELQHSARRESYISAQAVDSAAGKDIRIYRLMDWFIRKYDESLQEMGRIYGAIHDWYTFRNISHAFLQLIMNGLAFGLLVHMLAGGSSHRRNSYFTSAW